MSARELNPHWVTSLVSPIVSKVLKHLKEHERTLGVEYSAHLQATFLGGVVAAMVCDALKTPSAGTRHDQMTVSAAKFAETKTKVQTAVALGFQSAMFNFTGKDFEYYCQVIPVKEPVNKQPC